MTVLTEVAVAIILGVALAGGLALMSVRVPRLAAPSLSRRIAPYVRDIADPRGLTPLAGPAAADRWRVLRDRLARRLGGSEVLQRRLRRAGLTTDAGMFRARQLGWTLAGVGVGALIAVGAAVAGRFGPGLALLPVLAGAAAAVSCDALLTTRAKARTRRIEEELPTVLEFLALCLAAGEGLRDALRRVGEVGAGELTAEIRAAVLESGTGATLTEALTRSAADLDVPAYSRVVDHLVSAIDRGTPLAQVLQAQAHDAREDAKRTLIEQAGRKEILMLVPLVFLLLPLSVLFAVFPGVVMLRLGLG